MQDDLNIEIAGTLAEGEGEGKGAQARSPKTGWEEVVEIVPPRLRRDRDRLERVSGGEVGRP
jgi:hypothetical protein